MLLRNLNLTTSGERVLGSPYIGLAAEDLPLGFDPPCLLENDVLVGDVAGTLYEVYITSWPSAGDLYVYPDSSFSFLGAPDGVYTGGQGVRKYHPTEGLISDETTTYTITVGDVAPPADPRFARPAADIAAGDWVPSSGSDLFAMLSETTADSSTYISTSTSEPCEIALGPVEDPGTSSGQVVRYQVWSDDGSGITVRLLQGAVQIASWTHSSLSSTPTVFERILSAAECDSITNYSDLRIEFEKP